MAYAAHERRMVEPLKDGHTLRQHLKAAAAQRSRRAIADLAGPELPADCAYVWTWFLELHRARGSNGFGPEAIGYRDIEAWAWLKGLRLAPFELDSLVALDQLWLAGPGKESDDSGG